MGGVGNQDVRGGRLLYLQMCKWVEVIVSPTSQTCLRW